MTSNRKSPRAPFLDYNVGEFFITICTSNKRHYFGEIYGNNMHYSSVGEFAMKQLASAKDLCGYADVREHVVMPNHIHAIVMICLDNPLLYDYVGCHQRCPNPAYRGDQSIERFVPFLSRYASSFKGAVTKYARSIGVEFGWQARYHDHFIRAHGDRNRISYYIENNVARWQEDCFFKH